MKAKYYNPYNTDEERLCHRPPHLSDDDWRWLIHFWGTPEPRISQKKNKANRAKQVIKHTSGSKSYAQIRYEQDQFQQLLSQPEGTSSSTSASSGASTSVSSTSVASTYVDEIYTQVMGPESMVVFEGMDLVLLLPQSLVLLVEAIRSYSFNTN
ncbi:hypothetical protein CK203_114350 [Vitis vinifera]|uniref:Uncharacterized protein n=1 Tax=Vitis vinifera TaxID=29760 RepID=A0A438CDM4_VITVI|nr:hypothetical protein CK203_114350 [Vitis vinifera]